VLAFILVAVNCSVAMLAKGNQVIFRIGARVTAELLVVDLESLPCSTALAPPTIPLKDLPAQLLVCVGV
jgi:hypothetical protein